MRRGLFTASVLVSVACMGGFWELARRIASDPVLSALDASISSAIVSARVPWLTVVMRIVTSTGGTLVVVAVTVGLIAWQLAREYKAGAVFTAAVVAGGVAASTLAKGRFVRTRPPAADILVELPRSFSFPSGHTMASFCLAAAVLFALMHVQVGRPVRIMVGAAALLYACAVGYSRVYLGVHYPSDVVGSWLLGGAVVSACASVAVARKREVHESHVA